MNKYQPILNVYIIWHPDADALCRPLAQAVYTCLKRDPEESFARSIGITTYFRCVSEPGKDIPSAIDIDAALHPDISKANFVRLFDFEHDAVKPKLIHYIVHFRLCLGMLFDGDARMFSISLFADKL